MELDSIDKELEIELGKYPSNFDIRVAVDELPKEYILKVKDKMLRDVDSTPFDTEMETVRAWNFISFLYFILGHIEDAFEYNSKVLEKCSENMVALCNKSWFLYKRKEDFGTINEILEGLKRLTKYKTAVLVAKAEKAFCYASLGIKLYTTAYSLYKDILKECDKTRTSSQDAGELSSISNTIPATNMCIWRFGCALAFNRTLNISNVHIESGIDFSKQKYQTVCDLYALIINMDENDDCLKRYKARSYVELGLLVYDVRKTKQFPGMVKDILPDHNNLWMATDAYFEYALRICPNDVFVLERSGKYFRYHNKCPHIERSIELLKMAIGIRSTAFAHHHLALSLKRKLELQTSPIIPGDKQRATKQLFPRNTELPHQHQVSQETQMFPKETDLKMTPGPSVVDTFVLEKQTHVSFDPNHQDPTTLPKIASCPIDSEAKLGRLTVGEISECLTKVSLDSAFETRPPILNPSVQPHIYDSITIPQKGKQSEIYERDNRQSHMQDWNTPARGSYGTRYQNQGYLRRQNWYQQQRSTSEPVYSHYTTGTEEHRFMGRDGRRNYNSYHRGRSLEEGNTDDRIKSMIKSPMKPTFLDMGEHKEDIAMIILHLDKSFELTNNHAALYDKGLLFRQTEQTKEALDIFKTMIRNEGGYCSLVQLANAYEQAGLCLHDLLSESGKESEGDNRRLELDLRRYLKRSIEISCILVAKIPFLKYCWVSAPTLESFLDGKARTKEHLTDLYFLKKKFENYSEAVIVLKELKHLAEDETEKALLNLEIVRTHLRGGNYDDAVLVLDVVMCLPAGYTMIEESLYINVNIAGGIDALKSGDVEMARLRLRKALDFVRCGRMVDNDIQETTYDVFILCNTESEDKASHLRESLSSFCLSATVNSLSTIPGSTQLAGTINVMKHARHFIVICDTEQLNDMSIYWFEVLQQVILERGHGHIVVLATSSGTVIPNVLAPCSRFDMELGADIAEADCKNDAVCEKMEELMFKLASSNK